MTQKDERIVFARRAGDRYRNTWLGGFVVSYLVYTTGRLDGLQPKCEFILATLLTVPAASL